MMSSLKYPSGRAMTTTGGAKAAESTHKSSADESQTDGWTCYALLYSAPDPISTAGSKEEFLSNQSRSMYIQERDVASRVMYQS